MSLYNNNLNGYTAKFACRLRKDHHFYRWPGRLQIISSAELPFEFIVSADGLQYRVFTGSYINGFYIAVPSMFIASDISQFEDIAYNENKFLEAGMTEFWALTIAQALRVFHHEMQIPREVRLKYSDAEDWDPALTTGICINEPVT